MFHAGRDLPAFELMSPHLGTADDDSLLAAASEGFNNAELYGWLARKSDAELVALGLRRENLPRASLWPVLTAQPRGWYQLLLDHPSATPRQLTLFSGEAVKYVLNVLDVALFNVLTSLEVLTEDCRAGTAHHTQPLAQV
jgi:hypothetical protein